MEIKIKVAKSKKNNTLYKCIVLIEDDKEVVLSFDKQLVLKLSGLTYSEFINMSVGYYDIFLY